MQRRNRTGSDIVARTAKILAAPALRGSERQMSRASEHPSDDFHELTVTAAATAIRDGSLTAQDYAGALLSRSRKQADLNAFITLQPDAVLEAAAKVDQHRKSGKAMGPLHGVPIGIKDSMCTFDLPTSIGTQVLAGFNPGKDAAVVAAVRAAGAILFGKNNLVEMSYGLTGVNEHHGQAKNPYDKGRLTGGSSSGAGASVGGRLIPAALGGDTVGSIRVPASLCGVVGFRPTQPAMAVRRPDKPSVPKRDGPSRRPIRLRPQP
jgi:indoleacetamide hydrolase